MNVREMQKLAYDNKVKKGFNIDNKRKYKVENKVATRIKD